MADIDPYAGAQTDEERQVIYQELLEQYNKEAAEYEKTEHERKKEIHNTLMGEWHHYRKTQLRENRAFYRHVAMFAAGSFGVSFAFINNIVPFAAALHKPVLITGWALFAVTLIIDAAIHLISGFIHGSYCDIVSDNVQRGYDGKPYRPVKRWYSGWVMGALYILDFTAFIGGLICLIGFVMLNT
jgi:hypothetical protein